MMTPGQFRPVLTEARALQADLVRIRRTLHRSPEIGLKLPATQQVVLEELDGLDVEVTTGIDPTSISVLVRGGVATDVPAPLVVLRSDMDALPVAESSGEPFASTNGAMHACGHDLHMAMMIGAARLLAARRDQLDVDVLLVFQPGEEGHGGAPTMLAEPVLSAAMDSAVATYALHVFSKSPRAPMIATRPGPIMAGSSDLKVVLHGRGGHGSAPHEAADPVPAAASIVLALQSYVTRRFSVFEPVVISVGVMSAGEAFNIIPAAATVGATVRYFSDAARHEMSTSLIELCHATAKANGTRAEVDFVEISPPAVNDPVIAQRAHDISVDLFGEERSVVLTDPMMASEDYAFFLRRTPGALVFLGVSVDDPDGETAPNHAPEARFDDSRLFEGTALLVALALSHGAEPVWRPVSPVSSAASATAGPR